MFGLFFIILAFAGIAIVYLGIRRRKWIEVAAGIAVAAGALFLTWFLDFYGEMLWFDALAYSDRFWKVFLAKILLAGGAGIFGFAVVWLLTLKTIQHPWARWIPPAVALVFSARWGPANWDTVLKYMNAASGGLADPIYGKDVGFYLFSLPFYDALWQLLFLLCFIGLVSVFIAFFIRIDLQEGTVKMIPDERSASGKRGAYFSLYLNAAVLILVVACHFFLQRYHLMYSTLGAVTGPGWTDVHIRTWAYGIMSGVTALFFVAVMVSPLRAWLRKGLGKFEFGRTRPHIALLGLMVACLVILRVVTLSVVPGILQHLRVEPNEITFERPYIENNIRFTRHGFNLQDVEEKQFPVSETFTPQMVQDNQDLFSNIRLWDWRALDAVYKQFQEIRLYYEFQDVDIDRYTIDGEYRQVMVSARELNLDNLPAQSQTFVDKRFKYTHGYGMTLTNVNEFTEQGLPNLLIKDIPPVSAYPSLQVEEPRIYYGESTDSHVIVNSNEKEFDYPSGQKNVYTRYSGNGGVELSSLWRKLVYAWKFDGIRLLLSGYPTKESRIMFRRHTMERARELAPFLQFDSDPYIVLANGRMYWIIDAYTVSDRYPYSEPFRPGEIERYHDTGLDRLYSEERMISSFDGANYIRNSVKCVVDAYNGNTDFYVFGETDPVINTWRNIFPDLFKARDQMPEALERHIRYPYGILLIQGLVYAKYHMTDPEVFYNQEDLWIRATEKYYNRVIPVQPYYILWEPPASDRAEFSLILPFTPKKRQVLIGWIAGLCDPGSYGRMIAYQFPKEKRILGPQQVETKIDQDSWLSGQLTLWDQRGSNVIRGNVLAIPVEDTLIYVEPIYLQAETAAYPELRLVAVMHNDNLSYAESFDEALTKLFSGREGQPSLDTQTARKDGETLESLVNSADTAFENYLKALGEKRFDDAAGAMNNLSRTLERLKQNLGKGAPTPENGDTAPENR